MRVASSLSNRIFLACTLLAALSIASAFYFVNLRASREAEAELRRGLTDAATLVDAHRASLTDTFTRMARLIADRPTLKAAVATADPPTVQPLAVDSRSDVNADLLAVTGARGQPLADVGAEVGALPSDAAPPGSDQEVSMFLSHPRGVLQVVSVPILDLGMNPALVLGRLTVGFFLDNHMAAQFKALTGSEIAFAAGGHVLSSTIAPASWSALAPVIKGSGIASVRIGQDDYLALAQPMRWANAAPTGAAAPEMLVLRSRTEHLRFLNTLRTGLAGALIVTVLLATILSYSVARTVTRPLAAVTDAMRDVAATGDLTRKVSVRSRAWDDEDARLLATAFNTLTESIARFQRERTQRERLSSLGRLSTVIAHEIRNPLMIIRATLSTLGRDNVSAATLRDAVADIDEETRRLNRIVTEVLDFAKPMRFDLAEADLNDVCRVSMAAACAGEADPDVALDLDPALPPIVTDAERLRIALVNILANARHAVQARPAGGRGPGGAALLNEPGVIVRTAYEGGRVSITIRDQGVGITPDDMLHIFDPYFTTRRVGTGLGLPISKNIIDGLGGSIHVASRAGSGTEIRVDLPLRAVEAA
jgi:signal transduction histidine kinase